MLGRGSGQTWQSVDYLPHGEWLLALLSIILSVELADEFLYVRRYLFRGILCWGVFGLWCVPGHIMHHSANHRDTDSVHNADGPEGGKGGRCRLHLPPMPPLDIGVGGGKWFKESVRSCLLKRISNGWFHPFLVVPVASVVRWLLRMSLVCVNASCVSCVVRIKARPFKFKHTVYISGDHRPVSICLIDVLYGWQMQWFKSKTQYMSSPHYIFTGNIWSTSMSAGLLIPRWNVGLSAESFWLDHISNVLSWHQIMSDRLIKDSELSWRTERSRLFIL